MMKWWHPFLWVALYAMWIGVVLGIVAQCAGGCSAAAEATVAEEPSAEEPSAEEPSRWSVVDQSYVWGVQMTTICDQTGQAYLLARHSRGVDVQRLDWRCE